MILLAARTVLILTHLHVFSPIESAVTYFRYLITNLVVEHSQIKCFVKKLCNSFPSLFHMALFVLLYWSAYNKVFVFTTYIII